MTLGRDEILILEFEFAFRLPEHMFDRVLTPDHQRSSLTIHKEGGWEEVPLLPDLFYLPYLSKASEGLGKRFLLISIQLFASATYGFGPRAWTIIATLMGGLLLPLPLHNDDSHLANWSTNASLATIESQGTTSAHTGPQSKRPATHAVEAAE